jgi:hypothetical protein
MQLNYIIRNVVLMRLVTNLLIIHVKRVIIQAKNMQLLNNLRHNMTNFDTLYEIST